MLEFDEADANDDEGDDPEGDSSSWRYSLRCENKPADDHARTAEIDRDRPVEPESLRATSIRDEEGHADSEQDAAEDVREEGGGHYRHPECLDQPLGIEE